MTTSNAVGKGRSVQALYLGFCESFNSLSRNLLIEKLINYELDKWRVRWTEDTVTNTVFNTVQSVAVPSFTLCCVIYGENPN